MDFQKIFQKNRPVTLLLDACKSHHKLLTPRSSLFAGPAMAPTAYGMQVTRYFLQLGTMTWGQQNTEAEAHEQLSFALDCGINFIDAAEIYPVPTKAETQGKTEEYIGTWLKTQVPSLMDTDTRSWGSVKPSHREVSFFSLPSPSCPHPRAEA